MTYYYVMTDGSNDGTRTVGGYATEQTTNFATLGVANYYASIYAVLSGNTMVDDDEIICANTHDFEYGVTTGLGFTHNILVYSVLYTDLTTEQNGALEKATTGAYDIQFYSSPGKKVTFYGVNFLADDDIYLANVANTTITINNSELAINGTGSSERLAAITDGSIAILCDNTIKFIGTAQGFFIGNSSTIMITGGSIDYNSVTPVSLLYHNGNGGGALKLKNVDLSAITTGTFLNTPIVINDRLEITLERCKKHSGLTLFSGILASEIQTIDAWSIDAGNGYHYFESHRFQGKVLEDTVVYRSGGSTYDGTNGFSANVQPNVNVKAYIQPLKFKILEKDMDLTSVNTLTFHLAFGDDTSVITAFNNDEAWIEIVQNDATDNALGITIDTKPTTILTTPTALTTSTETWSAGFSYVNEDLRQIAVDTTAVSGMTNGQVTAYLCVAKYVSTLEIFTCADPVIT